MRMIWARKKSSPQAAMDLMHFVVWDFLKMFSAAVLCGIAVSVAAAGITLLLSGNAEARAPVDDIETTAIATPGLLIISGGCDEVALDALERDWYVRIDGKTIEVRVMQTWLMPTNAEGGAVFQVKIPREASLKSLSAQSATSDWSGQRIRAEAYANLSPTQYLAQSRTRLLVAYAPDGTISTSPIVGLQPGETVVVQYSYTFNMPAKAGPDTFALSLQSADPAMLESVPTVEDDPIASTRRPATLGSVWVEWTGRKPSRVIDAPRDSGMEREGNANAISGLSWSSPALQPGEQFRLSWLM